MKVADILKFTETFAPLDTAVDYDNVGVLIGNKDTDVKKVLLALDVTMQVAKEAKEIGAQLIISHHPIIFNPLKRIDEKSVIYYLIKNNITVLSLHTNLDKGKSFGVNTVLANMLMLNNWSFVPQDDFIIKGKLKEEMTPKAFATFVKTALKCDCVRYTQGGNVKTVCVSSGAGGDGIMSVADCDAYVTGEIKHHQLLFAQENNITVVEVGHFKSEDIVIKPLAEMLQNEFADTEFVVSEKCTDNTFYV